MRDFVQQSAQVPVHLALWSVSLLLIPLAHVRHHSGRAYEGRKGPQSGEYAADGYCSPFQFF